jgi:hypothetical protein
VESYQGSHRSVKERTALIDWVVLNYSPLVNSKCLCKGLVAWNVMRPLEARIMRLWWASLELPGWNDGSKSRRSLTRDHSGA